MFKRIALIVITLLILSATSLIFADKNHIDPISPNNSPDLQATPDFKIEFACVTPFLKVYYRIYWGITESERYQVSIILDDDLSIPLTNVSTGLTNDHASHNDEFFLDLTAARITPIFTVTWTDIQTNASTTLKFRSLDFKPCIYNYS